MLDRTTVKALKQKQMVKKILETIHLALKPCYTVLNAKNFNVLWKYK